MDTVELERGGWVFVVPASLGLSADALEDQELREELVESAIAGEEGYHILYRPGDNLRRSERVWF